MDLIKSDFKKGTVKLRVNDLDDLWYLHSLIEPGDLLTGKTTRKIRIGETDNVVKKTLTLKIEAESIDFNETGDALRINGKIEEGTDEVPKGSYHSITLDTGSEFILEKANWFGYQQQKLKEAVERKYNYLLCLFDREEAIFALTRKNGYEILAKIKGEVQKKQREIEIKKDFQEEIIKALDVYQGRYNPERVILASPAFYKEDLLKKVTLPELKAKIVLATCSAVDESALDEVIHQPELKEVLKDSRTRQEKELLDELLSAINKNEAATYGWKEVKAAIDAGAVRKLLLTEEFISEKRKAGEFGILNEKMRTVEVLRGEIHLISAKNESGKKLNGIGGIATLLRYRLY